MLKLLMILLSFLYSCYGLPEQVAVDDFLRKFHQNDYEVKFERAELLSYNAEYAENPKIVLFRYNRTSTAFNMSATFKKDAGRHLNLLIQGYKFSANDYNVFPMRFQLNVCDILSNNVFGFNTNALSKCKVFTGCPFLKGTNFNICNFTPDISQFPPYIPSGRYKFEIQLLYISIEMITSNIYMEIFRPFSGK